MDRIRAYAKINWNLAITGEQDGFHMLDGVMETVDLWDLISIDVGEGSGVYTTFGDGLVIEHDLCTKAATAFIDKTGLSAQVNINVEKHIPIGAGLGGGSSDCAAVLSYLNRYFDMPISRQELRSLGATLGADVAFFIDGGCQRARGKGEILSPVAVDRSIRLVLARPIGEGVSTAKAFELYDACPKEAFDSQPMVQARIKGDVLAIGANMKNSLEQPSITLLPEIGRVKDALLEAGCIAAVMTGSGSAVVGLIGEKGINLTLLQNYWFTITNTVDKAYELENNPCN